MKKDTFSLIVVPHDVNKTRTYKIPYRLLYVAVVFMAIGILSVGVFIATYGRLLIRAREASVLAERVEDLTEKSRQMGELRKNLAELHAEEIKVRRMLGLGLAEEDSLALEKVSKPQRAEEREVESEKEEMLRAMPSFWPVRGYITKGYNVASGKSDPDYHPGIDIAVSRGTPVRAAASGVVIEAGWDDIYGYYIWIDHGYGIKTLYGHNDRLVVMRGERVARGQTIAYSGNTGRSSAPHLHFAVTQDNVPVDPLKYLLK